MESLLLGTLSYYGNSNTSKMNKIQNTSNNYNTNIENQMTKIDVNQAATIKQPNFFDQFDSLTFDNLSKPTAENEAYTTHSGFNKFLQRDLDFKNGYSEFQNTDMHYGVVTKENFVHNNMQPNTSRRETMLNLNSNNRKYENLSGNSSVWKHKNELETFFTPVKDMANVNGLPVVAGGLENRYIASFKNNNGNLPFQTDIKVLPGLDGKKSAPYAVHRIDPRNVNELRSEINKKDTYINKPLETIKKGDIRAVEGEITAYKMPSYREVLFDELVPNKNSVEGPRQVGQFVHTDTERGTTDNNYQGGAYDTRQGNFVNKDTIHFSEAKKENYENDFTHSINAVNTRPVFTNVQSYTNYETDRDTITSEIHASGIYNNSNGSYMKDINNIAKTTIKQQNIIQDRNLGINGPIEKKTYIFSNDSVLPTTHRQSTNYNNVSNYASSYKNTHLALTDEAKQTIKETTNYNSVSNAKPNYQNTHVALTDEAKRTIKETTNYNSVSNATSNYQNTHVALTDEAKRTIKETTNYNGVSNATSNYQNTHVTLTDEAKRTIKETTNYNNVNNASSSYQNTHISLKDKAKRTIKETINYNDIANSVPTFKNIHVALTDKAKQTIKETTNYNDVANATSSYNSTHISLTDKAKQTSRETTNYNSVTNAKPSYQNTHIILSDIAKPTIKETTIISSIITNTAPTYTGNVIYNENEARPTIREGTSYFHDGILSNQISQYINTEDEAKCTIRETTEQNKYIGVIGGDNNKQTYTNYEDEARTTIRESTSTETPAQNIVSNVPQTYSKNDEEARTTIKELLLHQTPGGLMYDKNQSNYTSINDARPTIKETTLITDYTGNVSYDVNAIRLEDAEYNMTIRGKRQQTALGGRISNAKSDQMRGNINRDTVKFQNKRELLSGYISTPGNSSNYSVTPLTRTLNSKKTDLNGNTFYHIDPVFIDTLNTNPLVNDLMHQKNIDFNTGV